VCVCAFVNIYTGGRERWGRGGWDEEVGRTRKEKKKIERKGGRVRVIQRCGLRHWTHRLLLRLCLGLSLLQLLLELLFGSLSTLRRRLGPLASALRRRRAVLHRGGFGLGGVGGHDNGRGAGNQRGCDIEARQKGGSASLERLHRLRLLHLHSRAHARTPQLHRRRSTARQQRAHQIVWAQRIGAWTRNERAWPRSLPAAREQPDGFAARSGCDPE